MNQIFLEKKPTCLAINLKTIQKKWFSTQSEMGLAFGKKPNAWGAYINTGTVVPVWILSILVERTGIPLPRLLYSEIMSEEIPNRWDDIEKGKYNNNGVTNNIVLSQNEKLAKKLGLTFLELSEKDENIKDLIEATEKIVNALKKTIPAEELEKLDKEWREVKGKV